jgi:hypothetical protein
MCDVNILGTCMEASVHLFQNQGMTKYNYVPTNLFVNTRFFYVLDEAKLFDHFIKMQIPTLRCLLQSINGPLSSQHF